MILTFRQAWRTLNSTKSGRSWNKKRGVRKIPKPLVKRWKTRKKITGAIAVRRVRLGLLLSEIGQANNVNVSNQEMQMLVAQASQQYRPEDRQRFAQYIQENAMAAAQLRAPLYEDKVVDFLFDKAEIERANRDS